MLTKKRSAIALLILASFAAGVGLALEIWAGISYHEGPQVLTTGRAVVLVLGAALVLMACTVIYLGFRTLGKAER